MTTEYGETRIVTNGREFSIERKTTTVRRTSYLFRATKEEEQECWTPLAQIQNEFVFQYKGILCETWRHTYHTLEEAEAAEKLAHKWAARYKTDKWKPVYGNTSN